MRILMFGRGVIATIYGEALQAAGNDVEFYVRPGRASQYGDVVEVDMLDARRTRSARRGRRAFAARLRESIAAEDGFDLVVVSVSHHRLAEAAAFLAPRVGAAAVLVFGNVWEEPLAAVAPLPDDQVVFGFPGAGGGFDGDGVLHGALFRRVIVGIAGTSPNTRELEVQAVFRRAGFTVRQEPDMHGWLSLHFAADGGMFAQALRSGGLARMIGDRRAFRSALLTTRELLPLLEARGVDLRRRRIALLPYRFPGPVSAAMAALTARVAIARVSLAAHTDPDADEPRAVLRDLQHDAHRLGVATPLLESSWAHGGRPSHGRRSTSRFREGARVPRTAVTTGFVQSRDGTRIGYLRQGSGPGIVLVQGAMADVHAFRDLAAGLATSCTVISAERRGRGLSPRPYDTGHDIAQDIDDLDAILEATGSSTVFGLSSGAVITLEAARRLDRVHRAVVYEPPFYSDGVDRAGISRLNEEIEQGDLPSALLDSLLTAGTAPRLLRAAPRRVARTLARVALTLDGRKRGPAATLRDLVPGVRYDFHDVASVDGTVQQYAAMTKPVLLLSGTESPRFLLDAIRTLQQVLPNARHHEFPGLGHDGPWNTGGPAAVASVVHEFLDERR